MARKFAALLFLCLLFLGGVSSIQAQHTLGVRWHAIPDSPQQALQQMRLFRQLGFSAIETDRLLPDSLLHAAERMQFKLYVTLPVEYPTAYQLRTDDSLIVELAQKYFSYYRGSEALAAFGLWSVGQSNTGRFEKQAQRLYRSLSGLTSRPIYYISSFSQDDRLTDDYPMAMLQVSDSVTTDATGFNGYLYQPQPAAYNYLRPFKSALLQFTSDSEQPFFVDARWLLYHLNRTPELAISLQRYATSPEALFPIPHSPQKPPNSNWIVVFLVLAWGVAATHYSFVPIYRKSMLRYFFTHKFFVDDIMQWRTRTPLPGAILLLLNTLLGAILCYDFSYVLLTQQGLQALVHHYPALGMFGQNLVIFFVLGGLAIGIYEFICLLWLGVSNPAIKHVSQVLNLYAWPLQVNLVIVTLITTLMLSGTGTVIIYLLTACAILLNLSAFFITAIDTAPYMADKQAWFLLGAGLQLILLGLALVYTLEYTGLPDVLQLAASLP